MGSACHVHSEAIWDLGFIGVSLVCSAFTPRQTRIRCPKWGNVCNSMADIRQKQDRVCRVIAL
jgi:hypothetical protein